MYLRLQTVFTPMGKGYYFQFFFTFEKAGTTTISERSTKWPKFVMIKKPNCLKFTKYFFITF